MLHSAVASKRPQKHHPIQALTRPGEGVVVGMVRDRSSASGTIYYRLDFRNTPVPDRKFAADAAWVEVNADMVRVMFGQFLLSGPKLEHVVVLRLPFTAARQFIRSMKAGLAEMARSHLTKYSAPESPSVNRTDLPNRTFTLDANIVLAGFSGREACFDLYHTSPHVIVALIGGADEYRAEPVARVILTTRLMLDIYDQLLAKHDELPADHTEEEQDAAESV